jgi:EmrB/QacA subfamily drug resistance transporter
MDIFKEKTMTQPKTNHPQQAEKVKDNPEPSKPSWFHKWGSLIVLGLALAIIIIDTTLLNVSLATIIRDFHTDIQSIQWVITAYSLTLAALTITGGRIGDLFGRKKMFMVGAVIFAVGSFIASISQNVGQMIIGESIIEGVGAALMMPATASLLVANFKGRDRAFAFGIWGGIAGAASAIGPILGGYLTSNFSWRWGFRINIFVVLLLLGGSFLIKESRDIEERPTIDFVGVILSAIGLLVIVFGVIEASTYGWWKASQDFSLFDRVIFHQGDLFVPISIVFGIIVLSAFLFWERFMEKRGNTPLVSTKIFLNKTFSVGVFTTMIVSLGLVGLTFALPVFLQSVLGLDALHTGLALLPLSLSLLVVGPFSAFLSHKIAPKFIIMTGLIVDVIAMFVLRASLGVDISVWNMAPGLALYGAGMGMIMAQISNMTLSSVSVQQAGEASGINNTLRQVGSTLGTSLIGALLLTILSSNLTLGIKLSPVIPDQMKGQFISAVSNQTSNVEFGGGAKLDGRVPPVIIHEISSISKQATVNAAKNVMIYPALITLFAFFVSLFLPRRNKEEHDHTATPAAGH